MMTGSDIVWLHGWVTGQSVRWGQKGRARDAGTAKTGSKRRLAARTSF
jgi:hypothetical protein